MLNQREETLTTFDVDQALISLTEAYAVQKRTTINIFVVWKGKIFVGDVNRNFAFGYRPNFTCKATIKLMTDTQCVAPSSMDTTSIDMHIVKTI